MPVWLMSLIRTGKPALPAVTLAIPPPIKPPPNTATFFTLRGFASPAPDSFFICVVAKNKFRKDAETGVMQSSPKAAASKTKPFSMPCSAPVRIAAMIFSGAG